MVFKKFCIPMLAVFALAVFFANSAMAENKYESTKSFWYTGASPGTKLTGTKVLKSEIGKKKEGEKEVVIPLVLTTVVGEAKKPLKLEATGIECVGCTIENSGERAIAKGKLKFTGIKYIEPEPEKCSTPATNETKALTATVGMEKETTINSDALEFKPTEGETFTTVEITGANCSIASLYKVTGKVFAEPTNATEVFAETQPLKVSEAIQKNLGTATSLKFGANAAYLTGTVNNFLEPKTPFAVKNK